jgi:hypothetical protein
MEHWPTLVFWDVIRIFVKIMNYERISYSGGKGAGTDFASVDHILCRHRLASWWAGLCIPIDLFCHFLCQPPPFVWEANGDADCHLPSLAHFSVIVQALLLVCNPRAAVMYALVQKND